MADGIAIREAKREDFDAWLPLWDGYNRFYGRTGATALPLRVTETAWERFFDANAPIHALVAQSGDALVGLVHYLFHLSTTSIAPVCYLRDLFTAPESRGRGVATALIERVCDEARRAGAPSVYWQTQETNHGARKLYDKLAQQSGFIVYQKRI